MMPCATPSPSDRIDVHDPTPAAAGWEAELSLRLERRGDRTVIADQRHRGPLRVQRAFHPEPGGTCHTYILHPPAGIVGGDLLATDIRLDPGASGLFTTPGATRWNYSRGRSARSRQRLEAADGATLEWLPQETLFFDGTHARTGTSIHLHGDARLFAWEVLGFGRPACGEGFASGAVDAALEVHRDGRPLLLERVQGSSRVPGLAGRSSCGTLVATPAGEDALLRARELLPEPGDSLAAATRIDDMLVVRMLASRCEPVMRTFVDLWSALRPLTLDRIASPPRIWRT